MNVLLILGNPNKKSFNHAIADTCKNQVAANGHTVFFRDLYAENLNPVYNGTEDVNSDTNEDLLTST